MGVGMGVCVSRVRGGGKGGQRSCRAECSFCVGASEVYAAAARVAVESKSDVLKKEHCSGSRSMAIEGLGA